MSACQSKTSGVDNHQRQRVSECVLRDRLGYKNIMKASEFCYWLQGYIEIGHEQTHQQGISYEQVEIIKRHLMLVFKHELDLTHGDAEHQAELQAIHDKPIKPMFGGVDSNGNVYRC